MGKLTGKVALITGAAIGQGRAHAIKLAGEGADIIGLDICEPIESCDHPFGTPDDLATTTRLVEQLDRRMCSYRADVRDRDALSAAVNDALDKLGHIDIVIANAGISPMFHRTGDTPQAYQDALDVILTGTFSTIDLVYPHMIERDMGGSIVITASVAGLKVHGLPLKAITRGFVGYMSAKHGVVGLMRHYASSLGPYRIRVNSIHPTGVNTTMAVSPAMERYAAEFPEIGNSNHNALPVDLVEPEDIANAACWLCTDEARYITGVTLPVDAGYMLH